MRVLTLLLEEGLKQKIHRDLVRDNHHIEQARSLKECLECCRRSNVDCALIELERYPMSEVLRVIKGLRAERPAISLFALPRSLSVPNRLSLFEAGLDAFIPKPLVAAELNARLRSVVAVQDNVKEHVYGEHVYRAGPLRIDLLKRNVRREGRQIQLRPREFELLMYLVRNANRTLSKAQIFENVWNGAYEGLSNLVEVHISTLRKRVDTDFSEKLIRTDRGHGYILSCSLVELPTRVGAGL
jgi:DNA-binding response OmpR family regulator